MSIIIDPESCTGCGKCVTICPGGLLSLKQLETSQKREAKSFAFLKDPKLCWACASCLKECRFGALALFLPPALGGRGATLTAEASESSVLWRVKSPVGEEKILLVNRRVADRY
jgi:adenylylsulfate reductase subunit B